MKLYLLRHGVAEDFSVTGLDCDRRLTPDGIAKMEAEARTLAGMGLTLDHIITSPYPRASQTAEIVAKALGMEQVLIVDDRLCPGAGLGQVQLIANDHPVTNLMLVGHQPDMGTIAGALADCHPLAVKKGGLVRIDYHSLEPGGGRLEWFIPPSALHR